MIEIGLLSVDSEHDAVQLAKLRSQYAEDDHVDPHSSLERLPTSNDLLQAFRDADVGLVARANARELAGYGLVWSWVEDDGTAVHLLDAWAVPGEARASVLSELFLGLEACVRDRLGPAPDAVLGANSRSSEFGRVALLAQLEFQLVFAMVEMGLEGRPEPAPLPARVVLRTANPQDAPAVAALTQKVWADRPFFTMPDLEQTSRWLRNADSELFLLAERGSRLIGIASAKIAENCAEIDDVQVDPTYQRRGVASALVSELVGRLRDRTTMPVRLHTEAHDPAGGRSLYERLGFVVVATHNRYRKQLA